MISLKVLKFNAIWCSACLVMKKTYNRIFDEYKEFEKNNKKLIELECEENQLKSLMKNNVFQRDF